MIKETYSTHTTNSSTRQNMARAAINENSLPHETIPADKTINELRHQLQLISIPELSENLSTNEKVKIIADTQKKALIVAAEVLPHEDAVQLGIRADIVDNTSFLQPPTLESACLIAQAYDVGKQNPNLVAPLMAVCDYLPYAEDSKLLKSALVRSLDQKTSFSDSLRTLQALKDDELEASLPDTIPELFAKDENGIVAPVKNTSSIPPKDAVVFPVERPVDDWDY